MWYSLLATLERKQFKNKNMKKISLIIVLNTVLCGLYSQINVVKTEIEKEVVVEKYDSTANFLGKDAFLYKGQDFYFIDSEDYKRTFELYCSTGSCPFKINGKKVKYEDVVNKYYNVIDVTQPKKGGVWEGVFQIKLLSKETGDTMNYEYHSNYDVNFPFMVVGYYEKQKQQVVGKNFFVGDYLMNYCRLGLNEKIQINGSV